MRIDNMINTINTITAKSNKLLQFSHDVADKAYIISADLIDIEEINIDTGIVNYDRYTKDGITKFGMIFNLDNQYKSRQVAIYSDFNKNTIFYFDSFGTKPNARIRALIRQQIKYLEMLGKNIDDIIVDYNRIQHQKYDDDCSVYVINFLIRMTSL
jgi:hypothetical protein